MKKGDSREERNEEKMRVAKVNNRMMNRDRRMYERKDYRREGVMNKSEMSKGKNKER